MATSKGKEIVVGAILGMVEDVFESNLVDRLQELHDKHPVQYKVDVLGAYPLLKWLELLADKTKSKFDDAAVDVFLEGIEESAKRNGLDLPKISL